MAKHRMGEAEGVVTAVHIDDRQRVTVEIGIDSFAGLARWLSDGSAIGGKVGLAFAAGEVERGSFLRDGEWRGARTMEVSA